MKKHLNNKGMSLVEIIVSLAIFGVLSVLFLNVFLGGILLTVRSGDRAEMVAEAASSIEQKIADNTFTSPAIKSSTPGSVNIIYNYGTGNQKSSVLDGLKVETELDQGGQVVRMDYFIPGGST